jgi:type I restriction enzyme S subunit
MKAFEILDSQDHITATAVAESAAKQVTADSVLVVFRSGILAHTLPVAINRVAVTLNQDMKALTPWGDVTAEYLAYYLRSAQHAILAAAKKKGATVESLDAGRFFQILVPVPPVTEQRRIVARIEELAARIERARGLRQHAIADVEAIMPQAIAQALEVAVVAGHLSDVLAEKPRNGWSPRCDNRETGVPVLSLSAVTGFRYQEHAFKRTSQPTVEDANYWLRDGDLLITRSNTQELVGHAAIYNGFPSPCIYPDLMMRLVVDENRVNKRFVLTWLRSPIAREYITRNAIGSSHSMKKISQSTVMKIPFPTNLHVHDQQRIVARLDEEQEKVDAIQRMQAASAAELYALLPAVLNKAFAGEL